MKLRLMFLFAIAFANQAANADTLKCVFPEAAHTFEVNVLKQEVTVRDTYLGAVRTFKPSEFTDFSNYSLYVVFGDPSHVKQSLLTTIEERYVHKNEIYPYKARIYMNTKELLGGCFTQEQPITRF